MERPENYERLPDGQRCRCLNLMLSLLSSFRKECLKNLALPSQLD